MPMRQCSLVWWNTPQASLFVFCCPFLLVFNQHMSSHLRNPHFFNNNLPWSNPSDDPTHNHRKEGLSAIWSIFKSIISSNVQNGLLEVSESVGSRLLYSSQGGSIRITSNLVPKVAARSQVFKSTFMYINGVALS